MSLDDPSSGTKFKIGLAVILERLANWTLEGLKSAVHLRFGRIFFVGWLIPDKVKSDIRAEMFALDYPTRAHKTIQLLFI